MFSLLIQKIIISVGIAVTIIGGAEMLSAETINKEPKMRLHFIIPFSVETFIAITEDNIEKEGRSISFAYDHEFIMSLLTRLRSHPTNEKIIRDGLRLKAKFVEHGLIFLVDMNGLVIQQGSNATFRLFDDDIEDLESRLKEFVGVVDDTAYKEIIK